MQSGEKSILIAHKKTTLPTGNEAHYGPYHFDPLTIVQIECQGSNNFYAGFFNNYEYFRRKGKSKEAFNFEFGTDKPYFSLRKVIDDIYNYYLVLRVGVFTSKTTIDVYMESIYVGVK